MSKQILSEGFNTPFEILTEEHNGVQSKFIKGIFVQADIPNKNGRIYPESVMDSACKKFNDECVSKGRGVGELNHPDKLSIDMGRICHRIISLEKSGTNYYGKALLLNTSTGRELQALSEGGVIYGVSSRGFGSTKKVNGTDVVNDDFTIIAIDAVFHPSAPDALVQSIMEGQNFNADRTDKDMMFLESIRDDINKTNRALQEEMRLIVFKKYMTRFIL